MDIAIIGSTGHLNYVLEGIRKDKDSRIVGIAPGPEQEDVELLYKKIRSTNPVVELYDDYLEMINDLNPDIAVVTTYFGNHAEVIMETLDRNIPTFTEKPISTSIEDLELVRQAFTRSNAELASMLGLRYKPWFLAAKKAVEEGAIGEIRLINAQKSYKLGSRAEFYKHRETYGGTIPWVGSHAIDWLHWMSGEKFESVYALQSNKRNRDHGDLEVTALCEFEMSNEVLASVSLDYFRPEEAPTHGDDRLRLVGTEGVLEVRNEKAKLINPKSNGSKELPLPEEKYIFLDFLKSVRDGEESILNAEEALYTTEACLKARLSADKEKIVYF